MLHNEHVYLYYRYLGWLKETQGRAWGAFWFRCFASEEREAQNEAEEK